MNVGREQKTVGWDLNLCDSRPDPRLWTVFLVSYQCVCPLVSFLRLPSETPPRKEGAKGGSSGSGGGRQGTVFQWLGSSLANKITDVCLRKSFPVPEAPR